MNEQRLTTFNGDNGLLEILSILKQDQRVGPPTQFKSWHLLTAFLAFSSAKEPIGRYQLAKELELGDGSIRSLVKYLRKNKLIEPVGRKGHQLSVVGLEQKKALKKIIAKISPVPPSSFTVDDYNFGCHLRQRADQVTDGLAQRDAALRAGASGATTLVQGRDPDHITMPMAYQITQKEIRNLLDPFNLDEGDVLIIGSGPNSSRALLGTISGALTLI